jgi:Nop14-like family.
LVNDFHFEGFDEDEEKDQSRFHEKKKTKQEIYRELIHKSKKEKFHRQQAQMEAEAKVDELDNEFQNIIGMLVKK